MCGIFGVELFGPTRQEKEWTRTYARNSVRDMHYRGPDEESVVLHGCFALAFNRLAIVDTDVSAASQPYVSTTGSVTVLNGELYNRRNLDSSAPSEIALVASMIEEGADVRQYLEGDYAIANFDPSTSLLTLYRDRFGVCPLYYQTRPYVAISSEARRLEHPRAVPAHGRVRIDVRARSVRARDVLPLYGATSDEVLLPTICDALESAVLSRAQHTDSGWSLALSGGIDSSLIAAAAVARNVYPAAAITTGFSSASADMRHAMIVADHLGLPIRRILIPNDAELGAHVTSEVLEHLDCPAHKITALRYRGALRSYFVAKCAPTRVILCGDGADELLGGYPSHLQVGSPPWVTTRKRLSTLRSMQHFNLDRTNKMGMVFSKEYRAPFLASTVSQLLLSQPYEQGKALLRRAARYYGLPRAIVEREDKYSADEVQRDSVPTC